MHPDNTAWCVWNVYVSDIFCGIEARLRVAAAAGHVDEVKALLRAGIDPGDSNAGGSSALHLAAQRGHVKVLEELLRADTSRALLDSRDSTHGESALHEAAFWGHNEAVRFLLEKGSDKDLQSKRGRTALHEASLCGHKAVVETLLESRCAAEVQDNDGHTAMHLASQKGHDLLAALLSSQTSAGPGIVPSQPKAQVPVTLEAPEAPAEPPTSSEEKYAVIKMVLGSTAASDLKAYTGLDDDREMARILREPLVAMTEEWRQSGSETDKANWTYITQGVARDEQSIPAHVKQTFVTGKYHGGTITASEYDQGHDGMVRSVLKTEGRTRALL